MTSLTIRIEKIGLKDAGQCIDPYITVSVKDLNGIDLTPVQDTPVASRKEDTYVHFNVDIELQKHVEKLTKGVRPGCELTYVLESAPLRKFRCAVVAWRIRRNATAFRRRGVFGDDSGIIRLCDKGYLVQLSSLNSNTTSLRKGSPAPSALLSWRWMKLKPGRW
uniref:Axin interactor, dorsalization associated n=1 Tax=Ursus maritimus TaxID=29073 RepID=A0A452VCS9_URSMA